MAELISMNMASTHKHVFVWDVTSTTHCLHMQQGRCALMFRYYNFVSKRHLSMADLDWMALTSL